MTRIRYARNALAAMYGRLSTRWVWPAGCVLPKPTPETSADEELVRVVRQGTRQDLERVIATLEAAWDDHAVRQGFERRVA